VSNADLLIDAIDTVAAVYDAFIRWLAVAGFLACVLVVALVVCGVWGIPAVDRWIESRLDDRQTPQQDPPAPAQPDHAGTPVQARPARPVPTWADGDHHHSSRAA
jgi:hypothetical protein